MHMSRSGTESEQESRGLRAQCLPHSSLHLENQTLCLNHCLLSALEVSDCHLCTVTEERERADTGGRERKDVRAGSGRGGSSGSTG